MFCAYTGDRNLKRTGIFRAQAIRQHTAAWMVAGGFVLLSASLVSAAFAADGKTPKVPTVDAKNAQTVTPQQAEFFETQVRPLLFTKCYSCHNDKVQQGGLRLDSLDAMLKGGGGGPALVPSNVTKSHLLAAIRYDGALKMPPIGKLKNEEIIALTEWVKMGAPWPGAKVSDAARAAQKGEYVPTDIQKSHWSFQGVKNPALPVVKNAAWCRNPIDRFVLAKLEAKGLKPAPAADRRTLIRRVTFDLIGLPATSEEVDTFVNDKSSTAWEKVVDRLLASPRYGERWARHWLDVARYADTKGYVFVEDSVFHNAYTYRDYVIRAFNRDLRYDQFVVQQLAADLSSPNDREAQAAMGFVTLGRRFLNDNQLINDDRIDTTSRGLMGLTVACARCHDHKFDPISTKDYYSMYSVFDRTSEATPIISPEEKARPYEAYQKNLKAAEDEQNALTRAQVTILRDVVMKSPEKIPAKQKNILQSIRIEAMPNDGQLTELLPLFDAAARDRITALRATVANLNKNKPPMPEFGMALRDNGNNGEQRVFVRGNQGNRGDIVPRKFLTILSLTDPKPLPATGSGRLELAHDIASQDNPLTGRVFVNRVWLYHFGQGLVRTPSDFGLRGEKPTHPELLDWLAYHFTQESEDKSEGKDGASSKSLTPYACGWSIKKLHKTILMSNTYQMSSDASPLEVKHAFTFDPENRMLWRQNRQRLDLESLRDSLLAASGKLDTTLGGPAVELTTAPYTTRRTIYGFVNRNNLQGLYRTFDFATPDSSNAQRINTSVPQQSLFLMNSPFVVEQAQTLAQNAAITAAKGESDRIKTLYRRLFGRMPTTEEIALGMGFLHQTASTSVETNVTPWQYGWGEYDEKNGHVTAFNPFAHFTGKVWQPGPVLPDPKLDFLSLSAQGGHPGRDMQHVLIRRWVSPVDAVVAVEGTINHPDMHGDGVRGRIVSSRIGELGVWTAFHGSKSTSIDKLMVKKGDNIDFVVDCNKEQGFDSFQWNPRLHVVESGAKLIAAPATAQSWDAAADFGGPPAAPIVALTNWERYVQTLLMTNEFNFVD